MTGLLKDTFTEQAEAIGDPSLDLDAIVATGNKRLKRRRVARIVTAVAASAVVLAGGLTAAVQLNGGDPQVAGGGVFTERRPTWAEGKEIHFGSEVLRVKSAVAAFVQTNSGFVYTDAAGSVFHLSGGGSDLIGKGNQAHRIAVDADRSLVGWVDAGPKIPEFVIYDVAAHREVARTATGNQPGPSTSGEPLRVAAIDGGTAYFGASDGLRRWDIAKGTGQLIKPKAVPTFVVAANAGQVVWEHPVDGGDNDLAVGKDVNAPNPKHFEGWTGNLSPQARYLLTDKADTVELIDLRTSTTSTVTLPGYQLIVPTQWKGEHSFYAVGLRPEETERPDLLLCKITSAGQTSCEVAAAKFAPPLTDKSTTEFPIGLSVNE
ncbi:hypothetical protein [Streptomyces sp. SID13031]|uniref:hypothetical protein n=1 Tax=Streptomyces sp. SID13031 TaxID=2706046 RepID=UPI0013C9B7E5|nr:hypothetical protein [Streptomyces sp. SID13031]NEA35313.1 hypothetical protein [Streptomyces sp. SID13031]